MNDDRERRDESFITTIGAFLAAITAGCIVAVFIIYIMETLT